MFGTANLRFSKAVNIPAFGLQNPNAQSAVIQPYDPNLAVVEVPSTRDTYRIGAGIDLINLIQSIAASAKGNTTPPAARNAGGAKPKPTLPPTRRPKLKPNPTQRGSNNRATPPADANYYFAE